MYDSTLTSYTHTHIYIHTHPLNKIPYNVGNENGIAGASCRLLYSTVQSLLREVCVSVCVRFIQLQPVRAILHCHGGAGGASHFSGLSRWAAQAPGVWASEVAAYGLCSAGAVVVAQGLSCFIARGIFSDQGSNRCP